MKKLYRSKTNKIFSGLLGGIGEYMKVDPVIVRLVFIFLLFVSNFWPMVLVYIIAYFVVPAAPEEKVTDTPKEETVDTEPRVHDV